MAESSLKKLYVQDVEDWQNDLSKKRFSDKKPAVQVIERGIILPARKIERLLYGGVCDENFNFVTGFSQRPNNGGGNIAICINRSYTVKREELIELDEDVIFGGTVVGHFGHFLVECWSRLWYVIQNPDLKTKILFIISYRGYKPWFDEFFRLMGIDTGRIIYVDKPTQCRSITVPEQSQYNPRIFTKEFLIPYQAIKSRIKPGEHKKLYLTRTKFAQGVQCYNEQYFEDFFVAHGFEAISMENLKLSEQISLIMGADEIAATMGTLTHWALFCRPETKFIMLTRTHEPLDYQSFINEASGVDYCIVDASKNFMYAHRNGAGACFLGANKYWKEFVADYFGEQIDEYDDALYIENSLDKYINFWIEKYSPADNLNIWVYSLKSMCERIITLEKEKVRNRPLLAYQTHVGNRGWQSWKKEEQFSNALDQLFDIQAIRIDFSKPFHEIYYSVYFNAQEGWSEEVSTAKMAGTTGESKSITGIKIRLDEAGAGDFDIFYRVHKFDGEWTPWAKNGEELLSGGVQLNSVQIKLESKK